jgi:GTP-binding protein EngB required for normal cell division/uncharacterized protein (DUF697 family)
MDSMYFDQAKQIFDFNERKFVDELDSLVVLVAGDMGVGKSTLINALFGKDQARVGIGPAVTSKVDVHYDRERALTLIDTPGFETDPTRGKQIISDIEKELVRGRSGIHLALLAVKHPRFLGETHERFITFADQLNIPLIICQTNFDDDNSEHHDMLEQLQSTLPKIQENLSNKSTIKVAKVLAKSIINRKGETVKSARGIYELNELCRSLLPEAKQRTYAHAQMLDWQMKFDLIHKEIKQSAALSTLVASASTLAPALTGLAIPLAGPAAIGAVCFRMFARINRLMHFDGGWSKASGLAASFGVLQAAAPQAAFWQVATAELLGLIPWAGSITKSIIQVSAAPFLVYASGRAYCSTIRFLQKSGKTDDESFGKALRAEAKANNGVYKEDFKKSKPTIDELTSVLRNQGA